MFVMYYEWFMAYVMNDPYYIAWMICIKQAWYQTEVKMSYNSDNLDRIIVQQYVSYIVNFEWSLSYIMDHILEKDRVIQCPSP